MSQFDEDFAAAEGLLDEVFGDVVSLRRGVLTSDDFTASWQIADYEVEVDGLITVIQVRDFLIPEDVTIAGSAVTPRAGDRIVLDGIEYEILPVGDRPAVEDVGGSDRRLCHAKRVAA